MNLINKINIDPFNPTNYIYCCNETGIVLGCTCLNESIKKASSVFNQNEIYHFTNNGKEIINSGVFRFYWQMRNNNIPDEVLSKYWFTETNKNLDGSLYWQTHGNQWTSFSLAQITRTACFFTGKKGSRDADLMKQKFGKDIIKVNYTLFKEDVKKYCIMNNKILFVNKVTYVKSKPRDFYPLPVLGKTIKEVGLEISSIINNLMLDGTCFNKTQEHKFEHELRFIFFDEYAILDQNVEYIEIPISKKSMTLL